MKYCNDRKLQANHDRMKKRLQGIENGEIIVSRKSAATTVLIDDMQENTSIGREVWFFP